MNKKSMKLNKKIYTGSTRHISLSPGPEQNEIFYRDRNGNLLRGVSQASEWDYNFFHFLMFT